MMNKIKINIWDRDFELNVAYQNYPGEEVTKNQTDTLNNLTSIDFKDSKEEVVKYIQDNDFYENEDLDNLFRFVMPKSILITRDDNARIFAVMCNYKLDKEHGIAIVYENEKFKMVGAQDIIL